MALNEDAEILSGRGRLAAEILGWGGTLAVMTAYGLVSFKAISPTGWLFQVLNFTGSLGIIVIAWVKKVRQTVLLNLFWAAIAAVALIAIAVHR